MTWVQIGTENSAYLFDVDVIHHIYSNKGEDAPFLTIYFKDDTHNPIHIMSRHLAVEAYGTILRATKNP